MLMATSARVGWAILLWFIDRMMDEAKVDLSTPFSSHDRPQFLRPMGIVGGPRIAGLRPLRIIAVW